MTRGKQGQSSEVAPECDHSESGAGPVVLAPEAAERLLAEGKEARADVVARLAAMEINAEIEQGRAMVALWQSERDAVARAEAAEAERSDRAERKLRQLRERIRALIDGWGGPPSNLIPTSWVRARLRAALEDAVPEQADDQVCSECGGNDVTGHERDDCPGHHPDELRAALGDES